MTGRFAYLGSATRCLLLLAFVLCTTGDATGGTIYTESFGSATNDQTIKTLVQYDDFIGQFGVDGSVVVVDNQLRLLNGSNDNYQALVRPGPGGATTISTLVGADNSGGSYNVGLQIGQNNVVFHPAYGGAALRVEGPGGFGNTNVGFTPANGTLHSLEVASDGAGLFNITLTDGDNPANTWTGSFTNAGSVGGAIGLRRSGQPVGVGMYDDLTVGGASESFDTNTNAGTSRVFQPAGGTVSVDAGQLVLTSGGASGQQLFLRSGLKRDHTITAGVGASASSGSYGVGLRIGENNVHFHPGYGGGALRVEGPGGFGNQNVGFTPANGVLHDLRVTSDGTGNFEVTLTDGANPANTWTGSWFNPGSVGGDFGPRREGPTTGTGFYENLSIEIPGYVAPTAEFFDRNADMNLVYSEFGQRELGGGQSFVSGGTLVLAPPPTSGADMFFNHAGPEGPATISTLVGADVGNGSFNVGLRIGENQVVFHPGYGGGALRVEGPGGFGNTNVGFTPANGVLHLLEVTSDGAGLFNVSLTDGANPANTWSGSFTNAGSVDGRVDLVRKGPSAGVGLFDDFTINSSVESFDVSTDAEALYPNFTATFNGGGAVVQNGVLTIGAQRDTDTFQTFLTDGLTGAFEVSALVGADNSGGSYNVGLAIGENNIVFHPGLGGGAFRVEGPGGFGNTNVGFTPANGVLHLLTVEADGTGNFDLTLVDGADPSNVYSTTFFNPGSVGADMGLRRAGPAVGFGLFDNFIVLQEVPEPSTWILLALGTLGLAAVRRRRKG